ncbi:MAG: hypothetical protein L0211_09010 [Planctomycetaceae bacterium]|nr:hypothetical protein [Planctomycetaceae bacterium]
MAQNVAKVDVWTGELRDNVGGLAAMLGPLAEAGADLSFVIARRQPEKPGTGVAFIGGINGAKQTKAAAAVGLTKTTSLAALQIEATNKPGLLHRAIQQIASAGINLRGVSASVTGTKCVFVLAFDTAADRDQAAKILK